MGLAAVCTAAGGEAPNETAAPALKPLFSFAVFSDNKTGHPKLTEALKMFRNHLRARFIIGLGDHLDSRAAMKPFEKSLADSYGTPGDFYKIFYPVIGDNEDRHFSGSASNLDAALKAGWYERVGIARRDGALLRPTVKAYEKTHGDYYAVIEEEGLRIHLVSLYFTDAMKGMFPESIAFGEKTCREVRKKFPNDPLIVAAHETWWWAKQKLPLESPIFKADVILEASSHAFEVRRQGLAGPLILNTSSILNKIPGHVFEVKVYKDRFVVLALDAPHYRLGPYELEEWRKVWVKPFGKKAFAVMDWEKIKPFAGDAMPPADARGFNREKVLFTARTRQSLGAPNVDELKKELDSEDPETRAVALLSLGYLPNGETAARLLKEHLERQEDKGLRSHAVVALLRTYPRAALPLINVIVEAREESLLNREDFESIARQKGAPERLGALLDCTRSKDGYTVYIAVRAMRKLGPEAAPAVDRLIEILKDETRGRYLGYKWIASARVLGAIGPAARPAMPVLLKRLRPEHGYRYLAESIVRAIPKIGGPEAIKSIPRLRELLKTGHPIVKKAAEKALRELEKEK